MPVLEARPEGSPARSIRATGVRDVETQALTMAVSIVCERIRRLSASKVGLLSELVQAWSVAEGDDEREHLQTAMLEMLNDEPVSYSTMTEKPSHVSFQPFLDHVGKTIRQLRTDRNWTQSDLAEQTGLPQSHISRLENAEHVPSRLTLDKIALAFKVPVGTIDPAAE